MFMAAFVLAFVGQMALAANVLTGSTTVALIGIALAVVGLLLLATDWLKVNAQVDKTKLPAPKWPGYFLEGFRVAAGVAAIVISRTPIVTSAQSPDPALQWSVLLLGIFILFQSLIGGIVTLLPVRGGHDKQVPDPFNVVADNLVTAPGVVLGLLAVFGTGGALTRVVKVAAVALAMALLLGIVLNGLASMKDVRNPPRSTVVRLMFNLTLWALALGILSIAMGVVYRN